MANEGLISELRRAVEHSSKSPLPSLKDSMLGWAQLGVEVARSIRAVGRELTGATGGALLLPRMPNHLVDLGPLARELEALGCGAVIAAPPGLLRTLDSQWAVQPLTDPAPLAGLLEAGKDVAQLAAFVAECAVAPPDGLSRVGGARAASQALRTSLLPYVQYRRALLAALESLRPRFLVIGNPNVLEGRIAIDLARAHGVGTVALQHGSIARGESVWAGCAVDRMLTWGEAGRDELIASGFDAARISVVGSPRMDEVFQKMRERPKGRTILVASSGAGHQVGLDEHLAFIDAIYAAGEQVTELEWVVKLHPKDSPSFYEAAARKHPKAQIRLVETIRAKHGSDIFDWLEHTAVLITVVSTTGIDAISVGVPVISLQLGPDRSGSHSFLQACEVVKQPGALAAEVRRLAAGGDPQHGSSAGALRGWLFANQGHAARAAAEACVVAFD
jgi:hypothetical protein